MNKKRFSPINSETGIGLEDHALIAFMCQVRVRTTAVSTTALPGMLRCRVEIDEPSMVHSGPSCHPGLRPAALTGLTSK